MLENQDTTPHKFSDQRFFENWGFSILIGTF